MIPKAVLHALPGLLLLGFSTFPLPGTAQAEDLAVTEIMYQPPLALAGENGELEFIELKNTGDTPIDLTGYSFGVGIEYAFPAGTVLAPGAFVVLAENEAHFQQKYGKAPFQVYLKQLSDSGELLTVLDAQGATVISLAYQTGWPWPVTPQGHGFSLVPIDPNLNPDPNSPRHWRGSSASGGSPGADDPEPTIPPVLINEALAHTDLPLRDSIEIHNAGDTPMDITGWFLTDRASQAKRWKIPPTVIEPGGYTVFYESDSAGNMFARNFGASFSLSSRGGRCLHFLRRRRGKPHRFCPRFHLWGFRKRRLLRSPRHHHRRRAFRRPAIAHLGRAQLRAPRRAGRDHRADVSPVRHPRFVPRIDQHQRRSG